jgi:hypothetical protein
MAVVLHRRILGKTPCEENSTPPTTPRPKVAKVRKQEKLPALVLGKIVLSCVDVDLAVARRSFLIHSAGAPLRKQVIENAKAINDVAKKILAFGPKKPTTATWQRALHAADQFLKFGIAGWHVKNKEHYRKDAVLIFRALRAAERNEYAKQVRQKNRLSGTKKPRPNRRQRSGETVKETVERIKMELPAFLVKTEPNEAIRRPPKVEVKTEAKEDRTFAERVAEVAEHADLVDALVAEEEAKNNKDSSSDEDSSSDDTSDEDSSDDTSDKDSSDEDSSDEDSSWDEDSQRPIWGPNGEAKNNQKGAEMAASDDPHKTHDEPAVEPAVEQKKDESGADDDDNSSSDESGLSDVTLVLGGSCKAMLLEEQPCEAQSAATPIQQPAQVASVAQSQDYTRTTTIGLP